MIKHQKHGHGRVTDQASREIRHGRISRVAAEILACAHQRNMPSHQAMLLEWLRLDKSGFDFLIKQFACHANEADPAANSIDTELPSNLFASEPVTTLDMNTAERSITIGKGYPDGFIPAFT